MNPTKLTVKIIIVVALLAVGGWYGYKYILANTPLVPDDFQIPEKLETDNYRIRLITAADAGKDYEAVMASAERLRFLNGDGWPLEGFTVEENREDLARHEEEHKKRLEFTYTIVTPDENKVLGCVYIFRSRSPEFGAEIYYWARTDEWEKGFEKELDPVLRQWLKEK